MEKVISNRFEIGSKIGSGGMGTVYLGRDRQSGETVAIKQLKPAVADTGLIERFKREGQILRDLNHPNIVKMRVTLEDEGAHYLVMDYIEGGDLRKTIQQSKLNIELVLKYAIDLADALTRAHKLDIIHRDLKPGNVLIAVDGTVHLTDFGIAHEVKKARITDTDAIVGTIDYVAPEAFTEGSIDYRIDIWAFGVLLFEMLTGDVPFDASTLMQKIMAISTNPVPDLESLRPDIPVALADLIYRMLEKDRHARIVSMRHVGASLEDILRGRSLHTPPEPRFISTSTVVGHISHNLPAQTTEFVGREPEQEQLLSLISDPKVRILSIIAPGGMGKTRLALQLAERCIHDTSLSATRQMFTNGIYFVEFAGVSDPANIVTTIGDAIGYQFQSDERSPEQQLNDFLSQKRILLVVDNFEHLLDGVPVLSAMLSAAKHLKIIVTSRQKLHLTGEVIFTLDGMGSADWISPEKAAQSGAAKLFLQSARRVQPLFELTQDNIGAISEICSLVHGLPLGILLSASWLGMLDVKEIAEEITTGIDFLESELADLPSRHRSIRAVFEYSWNLMSENECVIFQKLSVFRGGFTREAAQTVSGANLKTLMRLMNKSLLQRNADTGRYNIHELLRQYTEERLLTSGDNYVQVYEQHALYYADFLFEREDPIFSGDQHMALQESTVDIENIRRAWAWGAGHKQSDIIVKMVRTLYFIHMMSNREHEGVQMAQKAIDAFSGLDLTRDEMQILADVHCYQCAMAMRMGNVALARTTGEQSLQLYDTLGFKPSGRLGLDARVFLCITMLISGDPQKAQELSDQMLIDYQSNSEPAGSLLVYYSRAIVTLAKGQYDEAKLYGEKCYEAAREAENHWFMAYALNEWGNALVALGEYTQAQSLFQKSYEIRDEFKDIEGMGAALNLMANLAIAQGHYAEAETHYRKVVELLENIGNNGGIIRAMTGLGKVMIEQGEYQQARDYLVRALQRAGTDMAQFSQPILVSLSDLFLKTGDTRKAAQVIQYLVTAGASDHDINEQIKRLQTELDASDDSPEKSTLAPVALLELLQMLTRELEQDNAG